MSTATPAELKAMFPAFAAVQDDTAQAWLDRAARTVTTAWPEADRKHGEMLLAAHLMTLNGLGTGVEAEMAAQGMGSFKSMRSGSLSLDRGEAGDTAHMGEFGATQYGRQFWPLLRANAGGPRVTRSGTLTGGCSLDPRIPRWPQC